MAPFGLRFLLTIWEEAISLSGDHVIAFRAKNDPSQLLHLVLSPALCDEVQHEIVHVQKNLECADS